MDNLKFVSSQELEELAKQKLDQNAFQYYRSGANEEQTLRDNVHNRLNIRKDRGIQAHQT
jgi:isopentenyl diphosphate isomerase/L-lactate dehydrogenase-like FMN-dependent dehydrogenase